MSKSTWKTSITLQKVLSAFVPPQHYYNVQIWMKGTYISQAVSKSLGIPNYFFYQDSDDRLEGMFGSARTISHGTNFDLVQFEERASHLMSLEEIYTRHPEMRKGSRRLGGVRGVVWRLHFVARTRSLGRTK